MKSITVEELQNIHHRIITLLNPLGFESHPFKISWYNEQVSKHFKLPNEPDSVAFIIISTPSMFEKSFIPFLKTEDCIKSSQDPLDQCMVKCIGKIRDEFNDMEMDVIHDFELTQNRRPRILVQTAGHVSGAVRYYQKKDVSDGRFPADKKIFGVCIHPEYGGWFALRAVAIFNLTCPDMQRKLPIDVIEREDDIVELLKRYNDHWEDWSFRNIINVKESYSQEQRNYFSTKPAERQSFIDKYRGTITEA